MFVNLGMFVGQEKKPKRQNVFFRKYDQLMVVPVAFALAAGAGVTAYSIVEISISKYIDRNQKQINLIVMFRLF